MPRRVVLAGTAGGLIVAALVMLGAVEPLELAVYDHLFEWRGPRPPRTSIVIVALDEASVRELDQWPFTRATYARLVDRVSAGAPLAIGLDLIFDTPSVLGGEDDDAFGAAVARAGNVVLAAAPTVEDLGFMTTFDLHMPIREIRAGARHVGHVGHPLDRDGGAREGLISSPKSYQGLPAFGVAVLDVAKQAGMPVARIPATPAARANFRGGPRTFPWVSFYRVVRGEVGADVFRGKIVLVGATGALFHDSVRTPFAGAGGMPGVEFLANLIETLAVGNRIREVPAPLGAVAALLVGMALGVVASRRPGLELPVAAVVIVVLGSVTYAVFVLFDIWCRAAGPALALALALVFTLAAARVSTPPPNASFPAAAGRARRAGRRPPD